MGNTAQHCRFGLFQDIDFAGNLADSKSTSGVFCVSLGVPISWMCKKQTSVSLSSVEAEVISLDAGLRMDGFPALALWDLRGTCFVINIMENIPTRGRRNSLTRRKILAGQTLFTSHQTQNLLASMPCCFTQMVLASWSWVNVSRAVLGRVSVFFWLCFAHNRNRSSCEVHKYRMSAFVAPHKVPSLQFSHVATN